MTARRVGITRLGQAGFRLAFAEATVYIDPYLSNRVEHLYGPTLQRLVPIWRDPARVDDADFVCITHTHEDHCDPDTLLPIAGASPACRFIGPPPVIELLTGLGLPGERLIPARESWLALQSGLRLHAVPAAHPEIQRDAAGHAACLGYLFEQDGRRIYHAGDTSLTPALHACLASHVPLEVAILPVNERNFFRERQGIIGNMSIREAFELARELGVKTVVPMHWDMFAPNRVFPEEITAVYRGERPDYPFSLQLDPDHL